MVTNISEEFAASVFYPKDGSSISLQNIGNHILQTAVKATQPTAFVY
jgi:hypothetical protein